MRLRWRLRRLFYWGDARKWHLSHQSLVAPTIRGKESSHMRGVRSFGSVPTCSGWGFSHIERFRPLRMTIREGGWSHRLAVSQPSPLGNAIKLSGRTFLAPHRGSSPKGLCKRTGFLEVKRRENPVRNHPLPVSSSRAQPRDLSGRPINGRRDTAGKRNTKTSIFIFTLTWITAGQGRFLDFARNDVTRKPPAANAPLADYTLRRYEKNALRSPSGIPPRCELVEEGHTEGSGWMATI